MRTLLALAIPLFLANHLMAQETYVVEPLRTGSLAQDYAPVLLDSTLVFCSLREREDVVGYRNELTEDPFSDLYRLDLSPGGDPQPKLLGDALTGPLNDGPATFTEEGALICFTRNQATAKKLGNTKAVNDRLGLFFAHHIGNGWTIPEPFPFNSSTYSVMHGAFSNDGQRLYFASDMSGGKGGMDLYVCEREGNDWSLPMNLGPSVNSEANEVFPFVARNGHLYFASDRSGGLGGLDILACAPEGDAWGPAVSLPAPINSVANDLGYTSYASDRSGYFSSDRDGEDRILSFRKVIPLFTACVPQVPNNYCFQFKAPKDEALARLPLRSQWVLGDGTVTNGNEVSHCYAGPGTYAVRQELVDSLTGDLFFTRTAFELPIEDIAQPYITTVDSIRKDRRVVMNGLHSNTPGFRAEEYHWDLGDGTTAMGSHVEHAWKEPGTYTIKMDLLGLDRNGTHLAHQCVSRTIAVIQRFEDTEDAPVVAQYQDASQVMREFAYQALPFDPFAMTIREGEDASFSIELFARKDRISLDDPLFVEIRKVYRVIERYDPERGVYTYSVGDSKDLAGLYEVYRRVKELHFLDAEAVLIEAEKVTDLSALELLTTNELDHTVVRASTVYFDKDQHVFRKGFEPQLNTLLQLLNDHPQLNIVIEAHTDAQGNGPYNLALSQRRAQGIVDYLVARGVLAERLVPVGHGENNPIASNASEDGRGLNRRVEFRLQVREDQAYERRR